MNNIEEELKKEQANVSLDSNAKSRILYKAKLEMEKNEAVADTRKKHRGFLNYLPILIPSLTAVIIIVTGISVFLGLRYEHYETVYIDINPSISLTMNRYETVVDYDLVNDDSKEMFKNVDFRNMKLDESVDLIFKTLDENKVINESYVTVNAISKDETKTKTLLERVEEQIEQLKEEYNWGIVDIGGEEVTKEDINDAIAEGLNPGKYKLILKIILSNPKYSIESLKDKTMAELMELLKELLGEK